MVSTLQKEHPDVLAYILSQKLCFRIHDHMVTHTPPTQRMVEYIFNERRGNIEAINTDYQTLLRSLLTDSKCVGDTRTQALHKLRKLQSIFLETGNSLFGQIKIGERTIDNKVHKGMWPIIRSYGINSWAYGHDSEAGKMASHNAGTTNRDGTTLIPVDTGAFKSQRDDERSIAICDQQGRITVGNGIGAETRHAYTKKDSTTGRTIARE